MKLDPTIAALRSNRAPQRAAQDAMVVAVRAWHAEPAIGAARAELQHFGRGAPLESCPQLEAIFTERGRAECLTASFSDHLARALRKAPLGHPPMRHGFNGSISTLVLARSGRAQLVLQAREPGSLTVNAVSFCDALRYEAVLAGEANAAIARRCEAAGSHAQLYEEAVELSAGARLALDCRTETLVVERIACRLVSLRLERTAANPAPTTEHDRATGRLLQQSCGDLATSRREMMVALLGRMGRIEAVPLLAAMAREAGDPSLRWQALRECLALDTAAGFRALCALAARTGDPLAAHAGALRAQLIEQHPQLASLEERPCPA